MCYIQQHQKHFAAFVRIDCFREVEPLDREVEQVQIIALASTLQIDVRVLHLDSSGRLMNHHDFPCEFTP